MEAVPDAVRCHRAIDPEHLQLSPDVVELVVADHPGTCLDGLPSSNTSMRDYPASRS
jgi:hypothetical protein